MKGCEFVVVLSVCTTKQGHPPAAAFTKHACMSAACMQPTATITKDARSWHCQVRSYVNDPHEVSYHIVARQVR